MSVRVSLDHYTFTLCKGEFFRLSATTAQEKHALLQLVSGILLPSSGSVQSFGRVAPLIELGVGFHPELTGEENIYLNASLYGLRNKETRARFNDIADFSGLGASLIRPSKTTRQACTCAWASLWPYMLSRRYCWLMRFWR